MKIFLLSLVCFLAVASKFTKLTFADAEPQVEGKRLIKTAADQAAQWLSQSEIWELIRNSQKFVDITDNPELEHSPAQTFHASQIPITLRQQELVRKLITRINETKFMSQLDDLSNGFFSRYHNNSWGQAAQLWWRYGIEKLVQNYPGSLSLIDVKHNFVQNSLIVRLNGANSTLRDQVVVLGAHFDSISRDGPDTLAPGADDNGSGTIVIWEVLRLFVEAGLVPSRTLEFQWYAGEEAGLLGSQDIAAQYKQNGTDVVAMLNQDVIGYWVPDVDDIAVHLDNGNDDMIHFIERLTDEYLDFGRRNHTCGYGCSDHAAWTMNGYPAAAAMAVVSNPRHHRHNDTIEAVNPRQVKEFVKLCLGFAVEMTEPQETF